MLGNCLSILYSASPSKSSNKVPTAFHCQSVLFICVCGLHIYIILYIYYIILCYIMLCYTTIYNIILYYIILFYIILYYTILCYVMLCYVTLCYMYIYFTLYYKYLSRSPNSSFSLQSRVTCGIGNWRNPV